VPDTGDSKNAYPESDGGDCLQLVQISGDSCVQTNKYSKIGVEKDSESLFLKEFDCFLPRKDKK